MKRGIPVEQWMQLVNSALDSHLHCPLEVVDHQALHQKTKKKIGLPLKPELPSLILYT